MILLVLGIALWVAAHLFKRVAPERRAFGMGIFFTTYYAIMSASPPVAGWLLDRTGAPENAMAFGAALFAAVIPATIAFRRLKIIPPGIRRAA